MILLRLLKQILTAEALGLLLVLTSLAALTSGISFSLRSADQRYLFEVCLLAALLGYLLSRSKWNGLSASVWLGAIGIAGIWILGARLTTPLLQLGQALIALIAQFLPALWRRTPIDIGAVREAWLLVLQGSSAMVTRWQAWLPALHGDLSVDDALIRGMIWAFFLWAIAAWTGWYAQRRDALLALLPQITLLAAVLSYSERNVYALWIVVLVLLLLMGIWSYRNHTIQWERSRLDYSESIRYDSTQAVLILSLFVGFFAMITPSFSWRQIRDWLDRSNESNQTAEVLGVQQAPPQAGQTASSQPALPREHLLTEGVEQSRELVMTIRTGELLPMPEIAPPVEAPPHYWRTTIYDQYMISGWLTSSAPGPLYRANMPLIPGLLRGYRALHLDVQVQRPEGRLVWTGLLFSADVPLRVSWRVRPQSSLLADQTSLLEADLFAASTSATAYHVEAYVPEVSIEQLRNASSSYPESLADHYRSLPTDLPLRVRQLARQITKGIENPYEKAKAIETYLRTHYPYDLDVPAPPADRDVTDYFLFDLKKGYCDYYATAMVVLARASGLPARFVSGYSSGDYDAPRAQYVVRERNAHSWPEIYFPEIGWIEFEPTASVPVIERPETIGDLAPPSKPVTPLSRFWFRITYERMVAWLSPLLILFALTLVYDLVGEQLLLRNMAPATALGIIQRRFYKAGRALAGEHTPAETAHEFAGKLIQGVVARNATSRQRVTTQRMIADISQLTELYELSVFSDHTPNASHVQAAYQAWRRLRRGMLILRIEQFIADTITTIRNTRTRASYKPM